MFDNTFLLWGGTLAVGVAFAWVTWIIVDLVSRTRPPVGSRYERHRREKMRSSSGVYRWFEPLIYEIADYLPTLSGPAAEGLTTSLESSSRQRGWRVDEFRATKWIEGCLVAAAVFALVAATGYTSLAGILAAALTLGYPTLAIQSLRKQQSRQAKIIRRRLPSIIDQLALMIEAGGNFETSLRMIVEEDSEHPLCLELSTVVHEIDAGRTRREALLDFRDRFADDDLSELVVAITKGEELGTPLSVILSDQAEQMRVKRSQWGEKAAAEAEVQIVFPGMLIMVACLIVIIAPILLPAAFNVFADGP